METAHLVYNATALLHLDGGNVSEEWLVHQQQRLQHVEKTLFAIQRNFDDFYFVICTAITFGKYTS